MEDIVSHIISRSDEEFSSDTFRIINYIAYLNDLLDQIGHSTVCKYLPLRCLVIKQYIKSCILVRIHSLIPSTKEANEI